MKLLIIKINTSHEVEDALSIFSQDKLGALGVACRKRSDFANLSLDEIKDIPEDMDFMACFEQNDDADKLVNAYKQKLQELASFNLAIGQGRITTSFGDEDSWQKNWQKFYQVINFSRHLALVPLWQDYQPVFKDQKIIKLDPGAAFGSGNHVTTQLALQFLERYLLKPVKVVDVGTGSGILSIAASLFGAKSVLATDYDPVAVKSAKKNLKHNQINNAQVVQASLLTGIREKFDLIIANMLAEVLLDLIPQLKGHTLPGARVIFSGIDYLQLPKIKTALTANGWKIEFSMHQDRWVALGIISQDV